MKLQGIFRKPKNELEPGGLSPKIPNEAVAVAAEPTVKCPQCKAMIGESFLMEHHYVCRCGHHFRLNARQRIDFIVDPGSFREMYNDIITRDVIGFQGYEKKIKNARLASGENEGVICGTANIDGYSCCLFVMEAKYMMGSMGTAVGERITRLFEYATEHHLPVVGYTVSGGARMQEGILSLMQMAKSSGAVKRHSDSGNLYLTVLTDPTTGGVTASFAMEGDIIMAEPGALVGFAGPRVIEQTIRKKLPEGFQKAEFLLDHGFVDLIVPRETQKKTVARILALHGAPHQTENQEGGTDNDRTSR